MKYFIMLFLLAIFLYGCSTTYSVHSSASNNYMKEKLKGRPLRKVCSYEQMNEKLKGQDATIELRDGREIYAKDVRIVDDSVSWYDANSNEKFKVNIGQLDKIIMKDNALGAWEGIGFGLLSGSVIGALIGSANSNRGGNYPDLSGLAGLVIGAVAGTVIGTITLGIIGHSYTYEFPLETPSDSLRNSNVPKK